MNAHVPQTDLPKPIEDIVRRLGHVYGEKVADSTVESVVRGYYAPLKEAKITSFVPNLVEHASRDRLRALAAA